MRQIIDTLAQLQRLRDKSVKDKTVELAKQKQICAGYDNNIKALGYLVEKTSAGAAVSVESLKNVSGYKGTLRKVIAWQRWPISKPRECRKTSRRRRAKRK